MNLRFPSIKTAAFSAARYIANFRSEPHSQRFIYYYSLQVLLGSFVKLFFIFLVSLALNIFKETIICLVVFSSIRLFSGGYHADTNLKCLLNSVAIVIGVSFVSRHLVYAYSLPMDAALFIIAIFLTGKYAPCDTPNKPIVSSKRRRALKIKAIILNIVCFIITLFLLYYNLYINFIPIIGLSALIEAVTITPWFNRIAPVCETICAKSVCAIK